MPVTLDVIAPMPEGWGLCQACELVMARANLDQAPPERGLDDLPADWRADFERLSALIFDLSNRYAGRVLIRIYDPRSLPGLIKAVRHRARRYPTFVVAGETRIAGWDVGALERVLVERVEARSERHA